MISKRSAAKVTLPLGRSTLLEIHLFCPRFVMAMFEQTLPRCLAMLVMGVSLAAALTLLPQRPAGAAEEKAKPVNSAKGGKALKAIQEDLNAKRYRDALSKLEALQSMQGLTPYDQHVMSQFFYATYYRLNDLPNTAKYMERELDDPFVDQAQAQKFTRDLVAIELNLKNNDRAIELGQRAIKGGYADEKVNTALATADYTKGDYRNALRISDSMIEGGIKKGAMPREEELGIALSSCSKLADHKCETRELERMVQYYPKPEYWRQLVYAMQSRDANTSDAMTLNIYRLASDVDALTHSKDYTEMAQLSLEQGSPGEAVRVLEKAFAKNMFSDSKERDRNQRYLDSAKKQAAMDEAGLPKQEQDAATSPDGQKYVTIGAGYLSYQQYPKAVELISKGLKKGGLKDEGQARLLLGIAEFKAGKKDDAIATFKSVKGDPTLERLANLWSLHTREGTRVASR
jgi:hypothetical protein